MGARSLQEHCGYNFTSRQQTVPLRQVGRGAKRRRGWTKPLAAHYYLITFPPPPHCVVLAPVPGGESGCSGIAGILWLQFHIATADCPPETGGRGAKRRRGWIKPLTAHYYLLLFHPLPTAWYSPLSQGEKVDARLLQEH